MRIAAAKYPADVGADVRVHAAHKLAVAARCDKEALARLGAIIWDCFLAVAPIF
jgi:hypothetical protein